MEGGVLVFEAALGGEEAGVAGEGETGDCLFMEAEAMADFSFCEVPHDDLCDLSGEGLFS